MLSATAPAGETGEAARRLAFGQFFGRVLLAMEGHDVAVREIACRPAERTVPRHTHDHAHFCLVISGTFETAADNFQGLCHSAALLFHSAGTTHADRFLSPAGRFVTISLAPDVVEKLGAPRLCERSLVLDDTQLGFPASRMRRELRVRDRLSAISVEGLALELIGCVLARTARLDSRRPKWLAQAVTFVRDRATDPARVTDLAEAIGVHPVHLARVFRHHLGLSPGEYLRRERVRAAMDLLERTREPLAAIAIHSGFSEQSELTKAFRRELGITPGAYRRTVRH